MIDDRGLATLLDLHGTIVDQGDGYWIKVEEYSFSTPYQLLEDFFADADQVLKAHRGCRRSN